MRTYSELITLPTYEERFKYLMLQGSVGIETFGFDRYLNQSFYGSKEWSDIRHHVIARDLGLDLAFPGREIHAKILIHHMNPLTEVDILQVSDKTLDPENLITTTLRTHNAIHFGNESHILSDYVPRQPGDTKLW